MKKLIKNSMSYLFANLLLLFYLESKAQIDIRAQHPVALPLIENPTVPINPEKGYIIKEIRDKIYYATDGIYQVMFILTPAGVVAIDAPPS